MAVGVEDGVDAADVFAEGLGVEVRAGVDEDGVAVVGEADGRAGAAVARVSVGEMAEVQTAQSQPSVGTPMEVPVPRKVRVACHRLADDARARRGLDVAGGRVGGALAAAERARACVTSRKPMRSSKRALSSRRCLVGGEVALGLFGEDGEHVDALAGAEEVDLGLLALVGGAAELHDRRHVDGLDELVEAHRGRMVHAGVGGADRGVEAVGGHLVGAAGLLGLLRRWAAGGMFGLGCSFGRMQAAWRLGELEAAARRGCGCGGAAARSSLSGEGSASGRSSPSMVNLRRSVTTKGLFCSDMVTLSQKIQMRTAGADGCSG